MFGELPKVFDKNFAVNYFLPVTVFLGLSYFLLKTYSLAQNFTQSLETDWIKGAVTLSLYSYLGGVILLVLNSDIYDFLSGYGTYNPIKILRTFELSRYQKMRNEIDKLDSEYISCVKKNKEFPEKSRARRNRLMREIAIQFPDNEQLILPTPFGNIIQSVETYSRVVYGIEYVGGWSRMLTAIPAEYRNIIESSKNQIDFWINTFVLSVLFMIEVIVVWDFTRVNSMLVVVSFITIVASLLLVRAQTAAQNWGEYVSTSFDVYRNKLLELLAFPRPKSRQEEKQIWRSFSQSIIYRRPDRLPEIYFPDNNQTAKPKPKKKKNMNA